MRDLQWIGRKGHQRSLPAGPVIFQNSRDHASAPMNWRLEALIAHLPDDQPARFDSHQISIDIRLLHLADERRCLCRPG
jgi:hypothetical protein